MLHLIMLHVILKLIIFDNFTGASTAQVTPLELTTKLMDAAIERGARLVHGTVEGIDIVDGKVAGVKISGA